MSVQAETAPTMGWAPRRSRPHIRAQIRAQNLHCGKKWQMGRLTLSYPGLWCGTSVDVYPMEFDADQLLGPPYRCAPDALSGDQKCKLRRDADRWGGWVGGGWGWARCVRGGARVVRCTMAGEPSYASRVADMRSRHSGLAHLGQVGMLIAQG